jgi:hypothetical protein
MKLKHGPAKRCGQARLEAGGGIGRRPAKFGQSRWHSLQAAEKALKAFITANGRCPEPTHILSRLHAAAVVAGMDPVLEGWIALAQCSAGVRYDPSNSTSTQANDAHKAACYIVSHVASQLPRGEKPAG